MKFKKGNEIRFGQDFSYYCGIPTDVDFRVTSKLSNGMYELKAKGYGVKGDYGNGSLYVFGLDDERKKRFEYELKKNKEQKK